MMYVYCRICVTVDVQFGCATYFVDGSYNQLLTFSGDCTFIKCSYFYYTMNLKTPRS